MVVPPASGSLSSQPYGALSQMWGRRAKEVLAMAQQVAKAAQQQAQKQAVPLREVSVAEIVARAISIQRKREDQGKTSRRVPLFLRPNEIPPKSGTYGTSWGEVRIFSKFLPDQGKWLVEVRLPRNEGFPIRDYVKKPSPSPTETPSQS